MEAFLVKVGAVQEAQARVPLLIPAVLHRCLLEVLETGNAERRVRYKDAS
ncbi:hypothetical protein [Thermus antranikianii]|nr:hypothetical protein [Thermus antranikianii]QWK21879.1 MAG: hypothetical protein KNN15_12885 [Thermus antranikianii]